jgi:23S rRNA (uracil1939-C5)-methyltransferase
MARSRRKLPQDPVTAHIETLSPDGRGVARIDGKAVFIHGALPGEEVRFLYTRAHRRYDEGAVTEVLVASSDRVPPRCVHFGSCGGCSLQHMAPAAQLRAKQQSLAEALERIGKVRPRTWLEPLDSPLHWGYRRKARLGAKYVVKKERVLVGFRERSSAFVADLTRCEILHPRVGGMIGELAELIQGLSIHDRVPQIELAMGDQTCVLVFRIMDPLTEPDRERLERFAREQDIEVYLQESGPDSVRPLSGLPARLSYRIPAFDLELQFLPTDFTQVNTDINRLMIRRAIDLLEPRPEDRVLDLFCGLGNFTLPLARRAGQVTGIEGDPGLVARARDNALHNGIDNVAFHAANLYEPLQAQAWLQQRYRKALLDPPRSGAFEVLELLPQLGVERLVYVSCYPSTLARDADALVHELGYRLEAAGVMDMFPHTAHVESIALFERDA